MSYVTRGKVQVELKTGNNEIEIRIDPVQEYAVKHKKDDWIVFINDDTEPQSTEHGNQPTAQVFRKAERLPAAIHPRFEQPLINAALKQTVLEIKIRNTNSSPPGPTAFEIESIRLPGTFGSDKA